MSEVLFLCPRVPYPLTGGAKLRMYHTAKMLSEEHSVDLLIIEEKPVKEGHIKKLEETFRNVIVFPYSSWQFKRNAVTGICSQRPLQVSYFSFSEIQTWVEQRAKDYDLIYCYLLRTGQYAVDTETPKILDFGDALSKTYKQFASGRPFPSSLLFNLESRRLRRYEQSMNKKFDHTFITTSADREEIVEGTNFSQPTVLPNGVKPKLLSLPPAEPDDDMSLVYLGKMDYFPNEDAVVHFTKEVLPLIRSEFQSVKFYIVGASPSKKVESLSTLDGVEVTGFVDDPEDYLRSADVIVTPLRYGSGIQNKILEAMAVGKPVVTTPLGASGINGDNKTHYHVAELDEPFAESVCELLKSEASCQFVGQNARELIKSEYSWDVISKTFLHQINSIIKAKQSAPRN